LFRRPAKLLSALNLVAKLSRRAERPLPLHLIYLFEACVILDWLKAEDVEHLHAHFGTNSAEVAMLVHELGGPPFSFTPHGPEEFDKARFIGLPEKIKRAKFVTAVSSFGRSQLYRYTPYEMWGKIKVVHCGLEKAFHENAATSTQFANRLVCVGRICEQKGQSLLVEAAALLAKRNPSFELVLAGDGEMRPELEALITRYKLRERVRITGWISSEQVRKEILAARALVLPSFAEGLPVVIMEAMSLQRPVVSTFIAGIPELVVPGEHGWLVPAGDVYALLGAMEACLSAAPEAISAMGARARAHVLERHDADKEAAKLADLFAG
jgi:glycosyltransferase involved in cell wall biosynthesis